MKTVFSRFKSVAVFPLLGVLILGGIGFYVSNTEITHAKSVPVVPALGAVVENPAGELVLVVKAKREE